MGTSRGGSLVAVDGLVGESRGAAAGEIADEENPEVGPGAETREGAAPGDGGVERAAGEGAGHEGHADGAAVEGIARGAPGGGGVEDDPGEGEGEEELDEEGGFPADGERGRGTTSLIKWTTQAATAGAANWASQ